MMAARPRATRSTRATTTQERSLAVAEEVRAQMVANVWKVVVQEGQRVEEGDQLVILESMKMEIPVLTESAGYVTALRVQEGDVVQEGDFIALIGDSAG